MITPKDAKELFTEDQAAFAPVVGAPNDDNVKRLNKDFFNALQPNEVTGSAVDLSDILFSDDDHKTKHGDRTSERMETPLKSYDDGITVDATNSVRTKAEGLWTTKIELQRLIKRVKRSGRAFLVAVTEETWILPLKEKTTFYNMLSLHDFFARLKGGRSGLKATDIIFVLSAMLGWWDNNPRVPEYIKRLEDAQKKSVREKLPINDMWISVITTGSLLSAGSFPKHFPDWDIIPCINKTWATWKTTFHAYQITLEHEQRATGEQGGVFGSDAATITIHGITTATETPGALITPDMLEFHATLASATTFTGEFSFQALSGHLDRMAGAAT